MQAAIIENGTPHLTLQLNVRAVPHFGLKLRD